jgi:branched-chain amino acid transport system substrate-binding protein
MKNKLIIVGSLVLVLALLATTALACGNGEEGVTPTPGITPTPGNTPTPTPVVKTVKVGLSIPLSGFGAVWGTQLLLGGEWARDRINEAGGIKVGDDIYMMELAICDDKMVSSQVVTCVTKLIYDDGCTYLSGMLGTANTWAAMPIFHQAKVMAVASSCEGCVAPENPYFFSGFIHPTQAARAVYRGVHETHPEIKTVALLWNPRNPDRRDASIEAAEMLGMEVIASRTYESGTIDFYPSLTTLVAKNPDAINIEASSGAQQLIIKQARELGYTGLIFAVAGSPPDPIIEGVGVKYAENYGTNFGNWVSAAYPEATRELAKDFYERYPGEILDDAVVSQYGKIMIIATGIEAAQSVDPTQVKDVVSAPGFEVEYFGMPASFGGAETFGSNQQLCMPYSYSEIHDGKLVVKMVVPYEFIP